MSVTLLQSVTPLLDSAEIDAVYKHLVKDQPDVQIAFVGLGDVIEGPENMYRLVNAEQFGNVDRIAIKFGPEFLLLARFGRVFLLTEIFDPQGETRRVSVH
jgi:hypothetical protein